VILIGTSGYNYPEWKGSFYPADLPAAKMLAYYAGRFDSVEINYTFYRMPTPKLVAGWCAEVPESFRFTLKAPRRITHDKRLRPAEVAESVRGFLTAASELGSRRGALLFQLPPNFKKDVARLGDLLGQLPSDHRAAFEFRHESWFADDVYERLRARNAALCVADTEDGSTPAVPTADWGYLRLRAVDYTDAQLADWIATMRRIGGGWKDAFVFFKHEERGTGPALAKRFEALLTP
jgi:uncharacterized protein YecE (DUF72 family)